MRRSGTLVTFCIPFVEEVQHSRRCMATRSFFFLVLSSFSPFADGAGTRRVPTLTIEKMAGEDYQWQQERQWNSGRPQKTALDASDKRSGQVRWRKDWELHTAHFDEGRINTIIRIVRSK
jgi:hypothetical protein